VDAFEIVNAGHPALPEDVRTAILAECARRRLSLVASSDWHGWAGSCRTWTLVRIAGPRPDRGEPVARAVVEALRRRAADDVVPVVAGRMGQPSFLRAAFAPLVESVRYACELSPGRVLSWWAWSAAIAAAFWWRRALAAAVAPVALLCVLGGAVLARGVALLRAGASSASHSEIAATAGAWAIAAGALALLAAAALAGRFLRRRTRRDVEAPARGQSPA